MYLLAYCCAKLSAPDFVFLRSMAATVFPVEDHALAQELLPHIEAWYGAWDHGERQPHTAMNSRV